ncbi:MAG: sulfatase [Planctomycetota bacterium]|nr:sulfatase [Planctomycetota bacterium]
MTLRKSCPCFIIGTLSFLSLATSLVATDRPDRPNLVLILADDLGWQDVRCYDIDEPCPMETPNLDALALRGVKFWQAYSPAPTCAPSRCAIMSGVHPARAQKTHVVGGAPPTPIHERAHPMMAPWYSGRMPADEYTVAKALRDAGYVTGHVGKWHMAIDHHAYPQPEDQGFSWTRSVRGARNRMQPDRMSEFATNQLGDPYQLDNQGFPYHENSEHALEFLRKHKDSPFFLYYATWLVHTPIHTRSRSLLEKYCKKLGVQPDLNSPETWSGTGQTNPFYCAMVEELDYYIGKVLKYLNETEDPRWPGHTLSENTYIIVTSDNGGMEETPGEIITDNFPLDRGKISAMEGGTRVPCIITGPEVPEQTESDVMINGLDFYPTLLSWAGVEPQDHKVLDGADLSTLLREDPENPELVLDRRGRPRDTMVWHFPHGVALESTIRIGGYKLIRNYNHRYVPNTPELELYQLYRIEDSRVVRVDIEEAVNLAENDPQRARHMNQQLSRILNEMDASYPYYNAACRLVGDEKKRVPLPLSHEIQNGRATIRFRENGSKVVRADLIYTRNGGERYEEWFRGEAGLEEGRATANVPDDATHIIFNLIDENQFLVSYPPLPDEIRLRESKTRFSAHAIPLKTSSP